MDEGKHRGVGADAEREGHRGDNREARMLQEHAQAVAQILEEVVERGERRQGAHVFPDARLVAERAHRGVPRLVRAEAGVALLLGFELEVRAKLAMEIVSHVRLSPERSSRWRWLSPDGSTGTLRRPAVFVPPA